MTDFENTTTAEVTGLQSEPNLDRPGDEPGPKERRRRLTAPVEGKNGKDAGAVKKEHTSAANSDQNTKLGGKRPPSRKRVIQKLMERKTGATMQDLMEATGWQAHSVRAAISGLRQNALSIERRKNRKGETVYAVKTDAAG
ncbi:MAG: DUF3489 domain-containing protein [Hyphomicrobiales bacterium]